MGTRRHKSSAKSETSMKSSKRTRRKQKVDLTVQEELEKNSSGESEELESENLEDAQELEELLNEAMSEELEAEIYVRCPSCGTVTGVTLDSPECPVCGEDLSAELEKVIRGEEVEPFGLDTEEEEYY